MDVKSAADQTRDAASGVRRGARKAARNPWLKRGARVGMVARSVLYVVIAWLAVQIAFGRHKREADQNGALRSIAQHTGGQVLLIVLAIAFAVYALWRLSVVFFGDAGQTGWRTRLEGLIGFVAYTSLGLTAVSLTLGTGDTSGGSAQQAVSTTARVMRHSSGRALVMGLGVIVAVVGAVLVIDGLRRSFVKDLQTEQMSRRTKDATIAVGLVGNVARGVVTVLVGALFVDAAWTFKPKKAAGVDGALQTLAHATVGPWIIGAVALGLLAFAAYSVAEARYRIT
jgi:hypothetical protein